MKNINKIKNKIQEYWDRQPCNSKHSQKQNNSKEYFQEIAKKRYFVERHIINFANFKKYKNKNVLEIGCGIGTDAVEFIKNNANYVGIDYSKKSIEIAKKRIEVLDLHKKKFIFLHGDAENLKPIKKIKKSFDLIYSFGVLHHTLNMQKCFDEIYKIADYKSVIKLMLYAKNSYKNFLLNTTKYRYEAQKGCPVVQTVDHQDLNKLVKNKFKIMNVEQDFIFPYKINQYKKNKYELIDHFKYMPKKVFKKLEKKIGEHMLITLKKIN